MSPSNTAAFLTVDGMEAFYVLVLRYLDGDCSPEEAEELKNALTESTECRERFVQVCQIQGNLQEIYAPGRAEVEQKTAALAATAASESAALNGGHSIPASQEFPMFVEELSDQDSAKGVPAQDAGADTVVRELSAEDTVHPTPQTPKS